MGQIKGNPTPSYQDQAYEALRPNDRTNRNLGTSPVMVNHNTTLTAVIDATFATDSDETTTNARITSVSGSINTTINSLSSSLHDSSKNVTFNTVAATSNGLGQNFKVGDDVWLGDRNVANTMVISGIQEPTSAIIQLGSGSQPSIAHLAVGASFPAVGSALAITGSLLIGHTGHLYFFNGGVSNGGWSQII